jgi:hypothetical protein
MKAWLSAGVGALLLAGPVAAGCGPATAAQPAEESVPAVAAEQEKIEAALAAQVVRVRQARADLQAAEGRLKQLVAAAAARKKKLEQMRRAEQCSANEAGGKKDELADILKRLESIEARLGALEARSTQSVPLIYPPYPPTPNGYQGWQYRAPQYQPPAAPVTSTGGTASPASESTSPSR